MVVRSGVRWSVCGDWGSAPLPPVPRRRPTAAAAATPPPDRPRRHPSGSWDLIVWRMSRATRDTPAFAGVTGFGWGLRFLVSDGRGVGKGRLDRCGTASSQSTSPAEAGVQLGDVADGGRRFVIATLQTGPRPSPGWWRGGVVCLPCLTREEHKPGIALVSCSPAKAGAQSGSPPPRGYRLFEV